MYELASLIALVRRRPGLAAGIYVATLLLGTLVVLLVPRSYVTESQVLVKRADSLYQSTSYPQIDALLTFNRDTTMETYAALAEQPEIARRVMSSTHFDVPLRDVFTRYVVVTPLTNADVIQYQVSWHDPEGSAEIANAFAREFLNQQRTLAAAQASAAAQSLSIAWARARRDLASADAALSQFESRRALADASGQTTAILTAIGNLETQERTIDADRAQADAQLASMTAQATRVAPLVDASKTISNAPETQEIEQQLAQERVALKLLRQQFTDRYPDVIASRQRITSLETALAGAQENKVTSRTVAPNPLGQQLANQTATLRAQVAGDSSQLALLRSQDAALVAQLRQLPSDLSTLENLQRQVKADETMYDDLESSYFNAVVARNMAVTDLSIVRHADPALAETRPPRILSILVIAAVASVVTLGLLALRDWADRASVTLDVAAPVTPVNAYTKS